MIRFLVTGATGMVGSHLVEHLQAVVPGAVLGTSFGQAAALPAGLPLEPLDVREGDAVRACIARTRPAVIYHLAAQSLPTLSWRDPWGTMATNVQGTINVFEAVRTVRATLDAGFDPMVVVACSSAEYGASLTPASVPIGEDAPLLPLHPYGVSKVAQDLLAFQYWRNERIRCIRARIFNTTGPRKTADVVADFAARTAAIARRGGALRVGNLEARRAILDVRDLIAALTLLAEHGEAGEAYNICAETAPPIGALVPILERLAGLMLRLETDPALLRPSDEPVILGRTDKLRARTGWRQRISLEETVRAVFEHEMARVAG